MKSSARPALSVSVDCASPLTTRPDSTYKSGKVVQISGATSELVKDLAKRSPLRAVFRDSSYDSDSTKINVEQIFKLLSPETEVKAL